MKQDVSHDLCLEILRSVSDKIEKHPNKLSSFVISREEEKSLK